MNIGEFIKPLFCEDDKLSLGRVGLWVTLSPAIKQWWKGEGIGANHLYVLGLFLLYNFSKKIPSFVKLIRAWRGADANI